MFNASMVLYRQYETKTIIYKHINNVLYCIGYYTYWYRLHLDPS